ncbi:MAG TPA: NADH-quinone oxidoreductase subunit H [Beutenbergiaceae bacterium]|nr:NADH-quinone oxidoreductase subunit H [Beutenbergiaceae bacterium]
MADSARTTAEALGLVPAVGFALLVALLLGLVFAATDSVVLASGRLSAAVEPVRITVRSLMEQRRTTLAPDALLWRLGAATVFVLALLSVAVIPITGASLVSTSADLVWFNAAEALLWAAAWLVGWGPNAVHSLVGGYRFLAQGLGYELPLMFTLITTGIAGGSLRATDIVAAQADLWFVVTMPLAFVAFLASGAAFAFWGPFAAPVGTDIAGGLRSELSGPDRLLLDGGRAVFLGATAAMATALFLGGGAGPVLPDTAWYVLKTAVLMVVLVVAGRRLPVLRPDRFVEVGWMVLVPATLLQALVVALLTLAGVYR